MVLHYSCVVCVVVSSCPVTWYSALPVCILVCICPGSWYTAVPVCICPGPWYFAVLVSVYLCVSVLVHGTLQYQCVPVGVLVCSCPVPWYSAVAVCVPVGVPVCTCPVPWYSPVAVCLAVSVRTRALARWNSSSLFSSSSRSCCLSCSSSPRRFCSFRVRLVSMPRPESWIPVADTHHQTQPSRCTTVFIDMHLFCDFFFEKSQCYFKR